MHKFLKAVMLATTCLLSSMAYALTNADADSLLYMKQEEKLARDVYQTLHAKWGSVIFANISKSEQRHMDALDTLLVRYKLTDTTPAQPGQFSIPKLQALYDQLIDLGNQSLMDALTVGELIEETDIDDIQAILQTTKETPIVRVLTNLQSGSYNHLAAFTKQLDYLSN